MVATAPKIREAEYSLFQLMKPGMIANPYPLYRKIREHEPVHWDPFLRSWVITGYAECVTALSKHLAARTPSPERLAELGLGNLAAYGAMMQMQLMFMDAPNHTSLRNMCAAAFSPKSISRMHEQANSLSDRLIDALAGRTEFDLVAEYASPFASGLLALMLGLPEADGAALRHWATDVVELIGNFEHKPERMRQLLESLEAVRVYLAEELARQRVTPVEGVIGTLLGVEREGGITEEQIIANIVLMMAGGIEEPTNLVCCGMKSLLDHPEQMELLTAQPALMASAVEELLRYESPTQHTGRLAAEDCELGGKQIPKGATLTIVVAAANRDPQRFAHPDQLDIRRENNKHLALGWSSHYCIGASLARLEGGVAIGKLLNRFTGLRQASPDVRWRAMASLRGMETMSLTFDSIRTN